MPSANGTELLVADSSSFLSNVNIYFGGGNGIHDGQKNTVRVTHRSGRTGSARHNDRSFLTTGQVVWADNIDTEKTGQNRYWTWDRGWQGDEDIELSELIFYRERYGRSRQIINARYVADGHPERVRTTDDLYHGRLSRPEEMILQIGDMYSGVDPEVFAEAVVHYLTGPGKESRQVQQSKTDS